MQRRIAQATNNKIRRVILITERSFLGILITRTRFRGNVSSLLSSATSEVWLRIRSAKQFSSSTARRPITSKASGRFHRRFFWRYAVQDSNYEK